MSSIVSVVLRSTGTVNKVPGYDSYGEALPYLFDALDSLAVRIGVERPSRFVFEEPTIHGEPRQGTFSEEIANRIQRQPSRREWHNCRDGLSTFDGLLALLRNFSAEERRAALSATRVNEEAVIQELAAIKAILDSGTKRNDFFRIEADS